MAEFQPFPKIPRLRRDCTITEKIDGTNAQVFIEAGVPHSEDETVVASVFTTHPIAVYSLRAGSRSRWLTPGKQTDNFGFAAWVRDNAQLLAEILGPGRHFGEWWGQGIQRGYGLDHKRFSLFNVKRWNGLDDDARIDLALANVNVVPVLYQGPFTDAAVSGALSRLFWHGSTVAPGFDKPEGVVVRHDASGHVYKVLCENDELPKGAVA